MLPISANFPIKGEEKLCCNTKHIYNCSCKYWTEIIYTDDMNDLTKVYRQYVNNLTRKEKYEFEQERALTLTHRVGCSSHG